MKLAIVSPYPPDITGIGQYGYYVSRSLARSGQFDRVSVLAGARTTPARVDGLPGLRVRYTWQPGRYRGGPAILAGLREEDPDLVWFNIGASVFGHSPLANLLGFLSLYRVSLSGLPTVVTLHELVELADLKTLKAPGGRLARFGARLLTRLATRSDVVCLTMRRYLNWIASRQPDLTCVHIPIGAYHAPERLAESRVPELLFFASLAPYKGLEVLLSAYASLLARYPDLRLAVAGAEHPRFPGYGEVLRRGYADLSGVRWLGQVPEDRVRELFARSRIVVLPYLASTGSSSVLYHAAMWGRPLVASGLPDLKMAAEEDGLEVEFFEPSNPARLAGAIRTLLDSPGRRTALAEHNFNAVQHRRPEATCTAYLQAFNLALEARRSPKRIEIPALSPPELAR